ncbi:probable ATP-dependent RNA helicase DDX28 [Saccostrea cucullata]|uniref:probable ATP-dependent RNA helicase DDX28 n=1 Tax=Saccostrea cuccullata TaxID=36930 RepID=UPI002ED0AEF7
MPKEVLIQRCLSFAMKTFTRQKVTVKEIPRLTVPIKMARNIEKVKLKKIIQEEALRKQRKGALLITCKNKKYNFHVNGKFDENNPRELASHGWKHYKSAMARDFFTINAHGMNPAVLKDTEQCGFSDLKIGEELCQRLKAVGIEIPTDVQRKTIQEILQGKNVMCAAQTGSGKTLAYLLPIMENILRQKSYSLRQFPDDEDTNSPRALILVPSRELAQQLMDVAALFEDLLVFRAWTGGSHTMAKAKYTRREPIDVLISTPGALKMFLTLGKVRPSQLQHVVLDEADTLLDDSFFHDIRFIFTKLHVHGGKAIQNQGSSGIQINLVSATMPRDLQNNIGSMISIDSIAKVTSRCLHSLLPHITQTFIRLRKSDKPGEILKIARYNLENKVPSMIFCNHSKTSYFVMKFLEENNIPSIILNGEIKTQYREGKFEEFQREMSDIIVCTDVASRGLDTIRTRHVVNYDFPDFVSDYIHRSGRVGRIGSQGHGTVTSFISEKWDVDLLWKIETAVRRGQTLHNVNANIKRKLEGAEDSW